MQGEIRELGARDVGGILQRGGTVLQTARYPDFAKPEVQQAALRLLRGRGIEALVAIGGDGTMHGALALHQLGFPVVGIPASIDNDVYGTEMAIGVDTALNTILEAIDKLRDTASSHRRAFIVETMGRALRAPGADVRHHQRRRDDADPRAGDERRGGRRGGAQRATSAARRTPSSWCPRARSCAPRRSRSSSTRCAWASASA